MSVQCDSCFDGAKFKNVDYEQIKKQAKYYAVQTQQDMALYKENGNWLYIAVSEAVRIGIPFSEVISKY